jgi:CO dehydrogenase maturation factor
MRVAFVGKGGAGKSVIAGTFARLLGAAGERVLALDSDPMPGLAFSVGLDPAAVGDGGVPDEATVLAPEGEHPPYRLRPGLRGLDVVYRYAASGPDGVRFLQLGKSRGQRGGNSREVWAYQQIIEDLPEDGWSVVGDLPGGTRQPYFGWGRFAEVVVVVAEPTASSLLCARRLAGLARPGIQVVAVASKTRGPADAATVAARTGLPLAGAIPHDPAVAAAERAGRAVLDTDPGANAVTAIRSLVDRLRTTKVRS